MPIPSFCLICCHLTAYAPPDRLGNSLLANLSDRLSQSHEKRGARAMRKRRRSSAASQRGRRKCCARAWTGPVSKTDFHELYKLLSLTVACFAGAPEAAPAPGSFFGGKAGEPDLSAAADVAGEARRVLEKLRPIVEMVVKPVGKEGSRCRGEELARTSTERDPTLSSLATRRYRSGLLGLDITLQLIVCKAPVASAPSSPATAGAGCCGARARSGIFSPRRHSRFLPLPPSPFSFILRKPCTTPEHHGRA